jgi:drug/metabolite transporter (DMT)-like permease
MLAYIRKAALAGLAAGVAGAAGVLAKGGGFDSATISQAVGAFVAAAAAAGWATWRVPNKAAPRAKKTAA